VPLRSEIDGLLLHAANSAATLREPKSHLDMSAVGSRSMASIRLGTTPPSSGLSRRCRCAPTSPTSSDSSRRDGRLRRTWAAERETCVGVLPIGYGDGVRRGLSNNADILVGGRRYPLVGTVSMDNVTIDLGPEPTVSEATRRC